MEGKEEECDTLINDGVCPSKIPPNLLQNRCLYDVNTTEALWYELREKLVERNLLPCFLTRNVFTPVLAGIESAGLCLDEERVNEEYYRESKANRYYQA